MKKIMLFLFVFILSFSLVTAAHTASIDLEPLWSPANTNVDYTIEICNDGTSTDDVWRVEIIQNNLYGNFACEDKPGWSKSINSFYDPVFQDVISYCQYNSLNPNDYIAIGECDTFDFSATTPEDDNCDLLWRFRTYDEENPFGGAWETWTAVTTVDSTPPVIDKTLQAPEGTTAGDCLPAPNSDEECWVTDEAVISFTAYDPGEEDACTPTGTPGAVISSRIEYCTVEVLVDGVVDESYSMTIYDDDNNDQDTAKNSIAYSLNFNEDTKHELVIECFDRAKNKITDAEKFRVDITAPETEIDLEAGVQYYSEGESQWLDTDSAISISAVDKDPFGESDEDSCAIGLETTYFREFYLADNWAPCESASACDNFQDSGIITEAWCEKPFCYRDSGCTGTDCQICSDPVCHEAEGAPTPWNVYGGELLSPGEESCHVIEAYSVDQFGNVENVQRECYFVDKTIPTMDKIVGEPKAPMCDDEENVLVTEVDMTNDDFGVDVTKTFDGINHVWSITMDAADLPSHTSTGVQVVIADVAEVPEFIIGWSSGDSQVAPIYKEYTGSWGPATTTLPAGMSVSGNYNELNYVITIPAEYVDGCDFSWAINVEATDPTALGDSKSHQQQYPVDEARYYTETAAKHPGFNGLDWFVTTETDIELTCVDEGDHPSGNEMIYWTSYKWSDFLGDWEEMSSSSVQATSQMFNFGEVSRHKLEWYCEDAVGKTTALDVEYFNVDNEPPVITKEVIGPQDGDCPPAPNSNEFCNIKGGETQVVVSVEDFEADHMSNDVMCTYEVEWNDDLLESGTFGEEGKTFVWNEDSAHILTLYCEDAVGNSITDVEEFRVDMKPPVTTKTYGDPEVVLENGKIYRWITSATDITLTAVDEKIGVEKIYYTNEWVSDELCEAYPTPVPSVSPTGDYVIPSTNDQNRINGWIHVNELSVGPGEVELEFVQPRSFYSCFEYRTDGDTSQVTGEQNWAEFYGIVDESAGLQQYPQFCLSTPSTHVQTFLADEYVEIRSLYGAEGDERFDWTRFDVLPDTSAWNYVEDDSVVFNIPQESCHIIQYYAVDKFGNAEDIQTQYVMVDQTAPVMSKSLGEPKVACGESEDCHYYMTQQTPITFECVDHGPHPVDDVTMYINVFWKETFADDWSEVPDHEFVKNQETWTFTPHKDSMHKFEYWCEDKLGNAGDVMTEIDVVDTLGPEIETAIEGPSIEIEGDMFINGVTKIIVDATDVEPHPVGDEMCKFTYEVVGGDKEGLDEEDTFMAVPFEINFPEESEHHLTITCKDGLGNTASVTETYFVDKTAPGIWKDYEFLFSDYYGEGEGTYWAKFTSADGLVFASVDDIGPHKSGIAEVKYKVSMAENDEMCKYPPRQEVTNGDTDGDYIDRRYDFDCSEASEGEWIIVDEEDYADFEFIIGEESCHVIEIMATDNVNKCRLHKQYVYVDETAPLTAKQIGMPKAPMSLQNIELGHAFYEELNPDFCSEIDTQGNPKCSDVTLLTPITLGCHDPEPHPSGATDVCYMVDFDGDDITAESYCADGEMNDEGYCCVSSDSEVEFYFGEESWHKLSYYCVDNVGNVGEPDVEYFKVEGTAFEIELNKKWNLVSVPVKLLDNSMQQVFADHEDSVVGVWTYEDGVWYGYSPDGEANDNLNTMNPGWGYWILTTEADMLTIGGSLFSPGPINPAGKAIYPGWNLIGYYGAEGEPGYYGPADNGGAVTCELMSLKPSVWDHGVSSIYGYWELLGNNKWLELGFPDNMDPGAGYWVYAYEEGQYVPSTTCDFMST